jgi:hypothetical protein
MDQDAFSILETLLDSTKWPTYSFDTAPLEKLASEAYDRDTFDGYLSYILITNQVCEEYARLLVREGEFTLLLHLVPRGFGWRFSRTQTGAAGANLDKVMFGRLLEILEGSIEFDAKADFIEACRRLNEIRNQLAHQLSKSSSIDQLRQTAERYRRGYVEMVHLFNNGDDEFTWHYALMVHDIIWDHIIEEKLASADAEERTKWAQLGQRLNKERANSPVSMLKGQTRFIRKD